MKRRLHFAACAAFAVAVACTAPASSDADAQSDPVTQAQGVAELWPAAPDATARSVLTEAERTGITAALQQLAAAMRRGDASVAQSALPTQDSTAASDAATDARQAFANRWKARIAAAPTDRLAFYDLTLDPSLEDLADDRVREQHGPTARTVYVVEELAYVDVDDAAAPARADMFFTVRERPAGTWEVVADDDAERFGLFTADHLWDDGPAVITDVGRVQILHHPSTIDPDELGRITRQALEEATQRWPRSVTDADVLVIAPRDQQELARLLHVTFDLSPFVAFATGSPRHVLDNYSVTGSRMLINPDRFLRHPAEVRQAIMVHELGHVFTHPIGGQNMPAWIEEGIAQVVAERNSSTGTASADALIGRRGFAGELPSNAEFRFEEGGGIITSYQTAFRFFEWLEGESSTEDLIDFYEAVGSARTTDAGDIRYRIDAAAQEVFGRPLAQLQTAWAVSARDGNG